MTEVLKDDARETARFAVYDALCVATGEAGLRVAPEQMQVWAARILESLLRADVGWSLALLVDADAALRMRLEARREALADHAHMVWARWMAWQGEHVELIPATARGAEGTKRYKHNAEAVRRWMRQAQIPYAQLTEAEKASDRAIADEYLAIVLGKGAVDGEDR